MKQTSIPQAGLYDSAFEKDSCGFGLIAHIDNKPSHWLVKTSIDSLARLTHRGAIAADGKSGDGCGLLLKTPEKFFRSKAKEMGADYIVIGRTITESEDPLNTIKEIKESLLKT